MASTSESLIRLENVNKSFGTQLVLEDVSFAIERGTAFCLLGRSGVGKSVTLKLLIGLLHPDSGAVVVDGENVPDLPQRKLNQLRRKMGFMFQQAALFDSISLGENVAFPLRRHGASTEQEIRGRIDAVLEQVGLSGAYDKMPSELSGGMRKRAGLARALAMEPSVLLVDEPSAGLDPITQSEIDELLLKQKREAKTTMVVVTHNIPSARRIGDSLALLHRGKILAKGKLDELEQSDNEFVQHFLRSGPGG
jgi:phospholipid/cholesterol/gamma-HCH transport system ATP-binding protein